MSGGTRLAGRPAGPGVLAASRAVLGGAGLMLGLLTLISVFVAVAGPRAGLALRTRAFHQTLARLPAADTSVEVHGDLDSFTGGIGPSAITSLLTGYGHRLVHESIPIDRPRAWAGITSTSATVTSGAPRAVIAGTAPQLELLYRDPLGGFARLVAGRMPGTSSVSHRGGRVSTASFEVAVTQPVAARFGLHPGSRLVVAGPDQAIALTVTGILRPRAPRSAFWTMDTTAARPFLIQAGVTSAPYWSGSAFVGPAEVPALEAVYANTGMAVLWDFPVTVASVNADQVQPLDDHLTAAVNGAPAGASADGVTVSSGLLSALPRFLASQSAMQTVLLLVMASLVVLGAVAVLLGSRVLADGHEREFALLRARGASLTQVAAYALAGGALAVVPAALLGIAAGVALTPGSADGLSWWLAALGVLAALAGPPLLAVREPGPRLAGRGAPGPAAAGGGEVTGRARHRRRARLLIADTTLILACAGGLAILRVQGLPPAESANLYVSAAPVLVAAPAAVLAARLLPLAVRWAARWALRLRGLTIFLALVRAARGSALGVLPTFGLVLALALVSLGGMTRAAIERGQRAAAWQTVGADAVIAQGSANSGVTRAVQAAVNAEPGVELSATAAVLAGMGPGGQPIQIVVVDPARYAALVARTPFPLFPAARLARPATWSPGQPAPALASPFAASLLGRGTARLPTDSGTVVLQVAAIVAGGTPAVPGNSSFVVVPTWAEPRLGPPTMLLVAGRHLDRGRMSELVSRLMPGGALTLRSQVLATLMAAPVPRSADLAFAIGAVCAAGLAVLVLLLALVLGARARESTVTRLAAMGCSAGQARRLAVLENAPGIAAAVAGGVACAAALGPLTAPVIDLTTFTGGGRAPLHADTAALAATGAALALLAAVTLIIQTAVSARRRPAGALRAGD